MCCFLESSVGNSKFILFVILVGTMITVYQQIDKIRMDISEMKTNSDGVPQMDIALKNLRKMVESMKEDLRESESEVRKLQTEVRLHKKDKTGLVDYAYGGQVISTRDTETYEFEGIGMFGFRLCGQPYLEKRILENAVMPGDCWPFRGYEGSAVIELIDEIIVTKLTLEHAPRELLPNGTIRSAPKEFSLLGLQENDDNENGSPHLFGQFTYSTTGPEVQTFRVQNLSTKTFKVVELKIHSNHGHPDFTCIYRIRIHGHPK